MPRKRRRFDAGFKAKVALEAVSGLRPVSEIANLFPDLPVGPRGGCSRLASLLCLEGILRVLTTGARWEGRFDPGGWGPERYAGPATCEAQLAEGDR